MKWLYKYDEDYLYVRGADLEVEDDTEIPESYTDVKPSDGLYLAKFDPTKKKWSESATQECIDSLQPPSPEPSEVEILQKQVADLYYIIAIGGA
ncbi:hypothetical protein [Bacillus licheniformis]|uniref:hypothetical protein n=1 Tax=Bacillus licheniformis TaxID=1402 RepID=UPI000FFE0273|nr:hypothetical protein [Bacillus licheniformis]QAT52901.1 hypothetical protein EQY74_08390 [Bacillus licheniformis]